MADLQLTIRTENLDKVREALARLQPAACARLALWHGLSRIDDRELRLVDRLRGLLP